MTRDFTEIYVNALFDLLERFVEGVYDVVSSFYESSKIERAVKLERLNWLKDMFADLVPSDFDKSNLGKVNQHLYFVEYFGFEKRDFEMLKSNADDLVKQDIPRLKDDLKNFLRYRSKKEEGKIKSSASYFSQVAEDVQENLRSLIRKQPINEREVQDHLEDLFRIKGYDFEREKVSIPYSTKSYIPDFTSESLSMAIDAKLCDSPDDEKSTIDEINADIPAYKQKYHYLLFIVYDIAVIRRLQDYALGIERNNPNVKVLIIKH